MAGAVHDDSGNKESAPTHEEPTRGDLKDGDDWTISDISSIMVSEECNRAIDF